MIIENTKAINDFDITAGNQYFKIFAVQISNNHIIIIQKEAGVILAGKGKIPYSTYDWECNFEIINKFEDDIQYISIYDYLKNSTNVDLYMYIAKSFSCLCEISFFYYINPKGESIQLGYLNKNKMRFYLNKGED